MATSWLSTDRLHVYVAAYQYLLNILLLLMYEKDTSFYIQSIRFSYSVVHLKPKYLLYLGVRYIYYFDISMIWPIVITMCMTYIWQCKSLYDCCSDTSGWYVEGGWSAGWHHRRYGISGASWWSDVLSCGNSPPCHDLRCWQVSTVYIVRLLAQSSLYVHKCGLELHSFHFISMVRVSSIIWYIFSISQALLKRFPWIFLNYVSQSYGNNPKNFMKFNFVFKKLYLLTWNTISTIKPDEAIGFVEGRLNYQLTMICYRN